MGAGARRGVEEAAVVLIRPPTDGIHMTHSKTPLIALAALLVLAGCQKAAPPADSLPAPSQAGATEAAKPAANGVVFTVVPGEVHMCDGRDRVVSEVSWQVADPAVTTVKVEVDTTTDPARKTFTAGGATGSEKTGDWVVQGVRFHLMDAATGKELASHQVAGLPCN